MENKVAQQILPTASNLIGFCLFIITSMHVSDKADSSIVDEFVSVVTLSLTFACLFSFVSIRSANTKLELKMERLSVYSFAFSLIGIVLIILLLVLGFID